MPLCTCDGPPEPLRQIADLLKPPAIPLRFGIYEQIDDERDRQDAKWGGIPGRDRRDDHTYAAVLGEEFGECCKAWLERDVAALREELIQVAAVAVAWVEEIDNGGAIPRPVIASVIEEAS